MIHYILFEKLHRYVFDYHFQNTNENFGKFTPHKNANSDNKYRNYNELIYKIYISLYPYFYKFRYKLILYFPKKYVRYGSRNIAGLTQYEIKKHYNFIDKILLNYLLLKQKQL